MKRYIKYLFMVMAVSLLGACSAEEPFPDPTPEGEGRLATSALDVSLANPDGIRAVKGRRIIKAAPAVADFTVDFIRTGETSPQASYKYSEMPEIITLPAGEYVARASYGDNPSAAWEAPYYMGESGFTIVADDITDNVDPIVCRFANVRVSVAFDAALLAEMSSDSKVTVKVGDSGSLDFTAADTDRSGYFAYVENSHTLTATFIGSIGGALSSETKAYDNVAPGTHYRITFRLHDAGDEDPGDIEIDGITVDASVVTDDMNSNVDSGEQNIEDDLRPKEDEEDPEHPVDPGKPTPSITAQAPIDLEKDNDVRDGDPVVLKITSEAEGGFTLFTVDIDSPILTPEELDGVGLAPTLDLVHPGDMEEPLSNLGFPVNVGGMTEATFEISQFIGLLNALGEGHHKFVLTVSDANGTTVKTLRLHNIP